MAESNNALESVAPEQAKPIKVTRSDDFITLYANNVVTDSTAWDMRLMFSQFDEVDGVGISRQKAAVSIPFALAKLLTYWMRAQIIAHEIETGRKINIRPNLRPGPPPDEESDPELAQYFKALRELYDEFIASLG
jgi:hypothetical protein